MKKLILALPICLLFTSSQASAFHIWEHKAITYRAVLGLQKCGLLPDGWDLNWKETIASANEFEDTNFLRKAVYSHYYNPNHGIGQSVRFGSEVSVTDSEKEMDDLLRANDLEGIFNLVGRMVHHIQDAAVPAHAAPVAHWGGDGFESFDSDSFYRGAFSPSECTGLAAMEPMEVLRLSALATLAAVEQPFAYREDGKVRSLRWSEAFWVQSQPEEFGEYGLFGNQFGEGSFRLSSEELIEVPITQYRQFKEMQLQQAVRATQAAILWANQQIRF